MMVRLYDYDVPAADPEAGVPSLRPLLEQLDATERRALLTGLFKPERIPGTMERLTTLVEDVDVSFANAMITLDNAARSRRFVAIDEARAMSTHFSLGSNVSSGSRSNALTCRPRKSIGKTSTS